MKLKPCLAAALAAVLALTPVSTPVMAQTTTATLLPPGKQCFQATTGVNGMVGTIGTITGGSGYVAGTYGGVALTGGSGSTATANITVAGGAVTAVTILNPGVQYVVGDVLSAAAASIGGSGSGFSFPVASTSINSSLAGGSVAYYVPSTLTTKQTWKDSGESVLNVQPVPLDANGCAIVYGSGIYRQILKDSLGNTVWDVLTASTGSGSSGGGGTITSDNNFIGTILPWPGTVAPTNYMFANGQTLSRTTYATLLGVLTLQQVNAVCSGGSTTLSGLSDTTQISIGDPIEGICIAPGTTVASKAAGSVVMSIAATTSTSTTVTFFIWGGDGDGATTFNLPKLNGLTLVGRNNMGGVSGPLISTYYGTVPDALGATGGAQSQTLVAANLPPITSTNPSVSFNVVGSQSFPAVAGGIGISGLQVASSGSGTNWAPVGANASNPWGTQNVVSGSVSVTSTGTSSTPFSNVQPSSTINYIIKVTVGTPSTSVIVVPSGATSVPLFSTGVVGAPPVYRAITGADLPNPSPSTLGGVFSKPLTTGQVLGGIDNSGTPQVATSGVFTAQSAFAFAVGRQGAISPALQVDSSTANSITGIDIAAQSTGNGVNLTAIGETNVPLIINGAGSGTISFGTTSTGSINLFRNAFILHDSNPTLTLGLSGGSLAHVSTPGTSGLAITSGGGDQVKFLDTASATRRITMTGSNGGNPTISTDGGNLAVGAPLALSTPLALASGGTGNTTESWHYIETLTASSSATLTTSTFTSAFDDYSFVFDNIVPATDSVNFNATVESAASFQATTYLNATALTTAIDVETVSTMSNSAGKGFCGTLFFNNVNSTSVNKFMTGRGVFAVTATFVPTSINVAGYWNGGQGAITRVRFQMSSGNIATGSIKVYGMRNN